jgi:hypothetical protein
MNAKATKTYRITTALTGADAFEAPGTRLTKRQAEAFMTRMRKWDAGHLYRITPND